MAYDIAEFPRPWSMKLGPDRFSTTTNIAREVSLKMDGPEAES